MRVFIALALSTVFCGNAWAAKKKIPEMSQIREIVEETLDSKNHSDRDLIDQRQVQAVLEAIRDETDWELPDAKEMMKTVLSPRHTLVTTLRTPVGQRFMRRVSKYKLVYDRLDRISQVSGGPELLKALIKLPDAARYARFSTRREVPDLLDLLPKKRNGKKRKIANYKKPTHRVYTERDLIARLEISRAVAIRDRKRGK